MWGTGSVRNCLQHAQKELGYGELSATCTEGIGDLGKWGCGELLQHALKDWGCGELSATCTEGIGNVENCMQHALKGLWMWGTVCNMH